MTQAVPLSKYTSLDLDQPRTQHATRRTPFLPLHSLAKRGGWPHLDSLVCSDTQTRTCFSISLESAFCSWPSMMFDRESACGCDCVGVGSWWVVGGRVPPSNQSCPSAWVSCSRRRRSFPPSSPSPFNRYRTLRRTDKQKSAKNREHDGSTSTTRGETCFFIDLVLAVYVVHLHACHKRV